MTNEEAIAIIRNEYKCVDRDCDIERSCGKCDLMMPSKEPILKAYEVAIQALSQEPCEDAISRQAVNEIVNDIRDCISVEGYWAILERLKKLPSVTQKSGKWINDECGNVICSECKRFRRDCRYGHTNYCNHCGARMVDPQESEDKE